MKAAGSILVALLVQTLWAHAELVWENPAQEFQRRPEEKELAVSFTFKNSGKQPVTIAKVTSSCGCTTAELPKKTYQPGECGSLTAKFTFGGRRGAQAKSIAVTTDDQKTVQLSFNCLILDDPVALIPPLVNWRVGESAAAKQVDISVAQNPRINVTAVASSNPRVFATLSTIKPGEKYSVSVTPTDTAREEFAQVFVQTDFPPEGPKAYTIFVRVK